MLNLVLIGAGSRSFGRGQLADILQNPDLNGLGVTLTLVDTNSEALDLMTRLALRIGEHAASDITIRQTVNRSEALPGADYVITAVARKRMELWEQDFRVPLAYGFRHCLGENGGPGALFHALRSLELILPICRDIEALCPNALLLNFTNPEARVLHAISHLTHVRAVGICHGVFGALHKVEEALKRPLDELHIVSAGINHFFNIMSIQDKTTGEDLRALTMQRLLTDPSITLPPLVRKLAEIWDVITYPSDDHIGEYLAFGSEYHGVKWPYGRESHSEPLDGTSSRELPLEEYASGKRPLDNAVLRKSGEITIPVICDIARGRTSWQHAVNVLNNAPYIDNLPTGAAVEVPAIVDSGGIHPQKVGALPEPFAAYLRTQCAIVELVTEAYRTGSKKLLLQALLLDPVVNSITAAERMIDDMLALQRDYLPSFA
jgi:alpha-galactosidase